MSEYASLKGQKKKKLQSPILTQLSAADKTLIKPLEGISSKLQKLKEEDQELLGLEVAKGLIEVCLSCGRCRDEADGEG